MADLTERLQQAVIQALANERPSLDHKPEQIASVTVELTLNHGGAIIDATTTVKRHSVIAPNQRPTT